MLFRSVPSMESPAEEDLDSEYIDALIASMSTEDLVAQLFFIRATSDSGQHFTEASKEVTRLAETRKPGGFVLFGPNITTSTNTLSLTASLGGSSEIAPFIAIDEEGGTVSRLYSAGLPGYGKPPSAAEIGGSGDLMFAFDSGKKIGDALSALGINVDFAPVCDIAPVSGSSFIGSRAFGNDPMFVSDMAAEFSRGLEEGGVLSCAKHFPGHGRAVGDTHLDLVSLNLSRDELVKSELLPFIRLIDEGASFIMVGHIVCPLVDDSGLPASLSPVLITDILRRQLGYDGLVISDSLGMGAISENFSSGKAAVMSLKAGNDMLLLPQNFNAAFEGVMAAIQNGEITLERVEESVRRILEVKLRAGIISRT